MLFVNAYAHDPTLFGPVHRLNSVITVQPKHVVRGRVPQSLSDDISTPVGPWLSNLVDLRDANATQFPEPPCSHTAVMDIQ